MALDLSLVNPAKEKFLKEVGETEEIQRAYEFADKAHQGQKRESGEPFFVHPVWVAKVVAQLGVGQRAVIAALLHDCVEDTVVTLEEIARNFGDETALLVEGLTEVKKRTKGVEMHQVDVDTFRKFLFSSVNDVRVLIVRIVDKLHNGLTIKYLSKDRQEKYARRIFGIYSPVAEYVGLHYFKKLLDDIAFEILYPEEARQLKEEMDKQAKDEVLALAMVREEVGKMIEANRLDRVEIQGRIKSLYSTFLKERKGREVMDRVGVRILTETVADCYTMLGLLHSKYTYLPEEFDDYISNPKPNGYRSLQTTLNWRNKLTLEVQIRTKEMHDFNEFGPASHIVYKMNKGEYDGMGMEWVRDLVKWQTDDNRIRKYQIEVLKSYVYVFTPKGDIIQMPLRSTALDFAYRIHEMVGHRCVGAKINQKMAKIETELKNGDLVEILCGTKKNVNEDWLAIAKTVGAKGHIRKAVQQKNRS